MKKRLKILFISHSPFENGAELTLFNLIINLDRSRFEPHVVFPQEGPLEKKAKKLNIHTYISPIERWIRFEYDEPTTKVTLIDRVNLLRKLIVTLDIDIVHTNTSVIIEGALAAALTETPHIWHFHEFLKEHPELKPIFPLPFVFSIVKNLSDCIVAVSDFVKGQFKEYSDSEIITIYNGIAEINCTLSSNYFRRFFELKNEDIIIIDIGLLSETKGFLNFINAAGLSSSQNENLKFFWIGGALKDSMKKFEKAVKVNKLKGTVFYIGHSKNVNDLIQSSDILVCSSLLETLSLTILEAMAASKPVVSTDCGGPAECIIEGETGHLVPVNDSIAMSMRIIELAGNPEKRNLFGENGFRLYKEKFTLSNFVKKFEDLYVRITKSTNYEINKRSRLESVYEILYRYEPQSKEIWNNMKAAKYRKLMKRLKFN